MARIDLKEVSVEFPVYNISARSFKKKFLRLATGGSIVEDANNHVVVRALNNISFTLHHGDRLGLIGHNGAGKSTLLRLLSNIYEPTRGKICINGRVTPLLNIAQGIETELTGYDNIAIRGTLLGFSRKQIKETAEQIAEFTGLGDYLAMPLRTYSAGMMVRLAFAISTSIKPEILLIDEVFGAGDANFMQKAQDKMISLLDQSSIVVMANHSAEIIQRFCNKALLLAGGHVQYFGSVEKAFELCNSQE